MFSILALILVLLLGVSACSATDVSDDTIDTLDVDTSITSMNSVSEQSTTNNNIKSNIKELKKDSEPLVITNKSYSTYFEDGIATEALSGVKSIELSGEFSNRNFTFDSTISISSASTQAVLHNSTFTFLEGSDGSEVYGLVINNTQYSKTVFDLYGVGGLVIDGNTIIQENSEDSTYAFCLNESNGNIISNNIINVTGKAYNVDYNYYGTMGVNKLSAIQGYKSSYNTITANTINTKASSRDSDSKTDTTIGIEFCTDAFSYDDDESEANIITENTFNTIGQTYAYSLRLNNKIEEFEITSNNITTKADYAYGVEYAYGSDGVIADNNITVNATNMAYGIVLTTNSMGTTADDIIENNTITAQANTIYMIEVYGARRSIINNNTLNGTGARVIGVASTSNAVYNNITRNNITITTNSSITAVTNMEQISADNNGIKLVKVDDNNITENNITITDLAGTSIYTINVIGSDNNIRLNTLITNDKTGHKSINASTINNTIDTNYPINPDMVTITITLPVLEVGQTGELRTTLVDTDNNILQYGNVTFTVDETVIGQSSVINGTAKIQYTAQTSGEHTVTATYTGNTVYNEAKITEKLTVILESTYNGIIYVSMDGNDINDGSINNPKKTLESAIYSATKTGASHSIIIKTGTYTIIGQKITTNLTITGEENTIITADNKGKIFEVSSGTLTLKGLKFINGNSTNGGVINTTTDLIIIDCVFEDNYADNYGGAIKTSTNLNITGTTFTNNTAKTHGGAIYSTLQTNNTLYSDNNIFNKNHALSHGGAIYLTSYGKAVINNTQFTNNNASSQGGAIYSGVNITINNTKFNSNTASNGGDLYLNKKSEITNSSFKNTIVKSQGVIYIYGNYNYTIEDIQIDNTTVSTGVLYINGINKVDITNITINNTKATTASIIYINSGKNVTITDSQITNNNATRRLINVNNRQTILNITNTKLVNNTAYIFIESTGTINIKDTHFENNTATNETDFFRKYATTANITSINNTFTGNNLPITLKADITTNYKALTENMITITLTTNEIYNTTPNTGIINIIDNNEVVATATVTGGVAQVTYIPQTIGTKTLEIQYTDETHSFITKTITTEVTIEQVTTIITVNPVNARISDIINITATINTDSNMPVNGGRVVFKVNGKTLRDSDGNIIYVTVKDSKAVITNFTVPKSWTNPEYKISAVYSGNSECISSRSSNSTLTIEKRSAKLELKQVTAKAGQTIKLSVKITDNNENVNNGKVVFKLNGKTLRDENGNNIYAVVEDSVATIEYTLPTKIAAKNYKLTAVFASGIYERVDINSTLTII
ncbi:hypothetical protein NL43_07205 [Methanosphaera sp. WGK6]|nr:hypothetical protein NL43_07205 [Methanosphaera sp. WGK6]